MLEESLYELKFTLPQHRVENLRSYLTQTLLPDPKFPTGKISTIYYDSEALESLRQKVNSDYRKTKLRLRWYLDQNLQIQGDSAFLEIKNRFGSRRQKIHKDSQFSPRWLADCDLNDPLLNKFSEEALETGELIPFPLFPILELRYDRMRFIDLLTGARLALDSDIQVMKVNRRFLGGVNPQILPNAVFEHKAPVDQLPRHLLSVVALGGRKESFSKYLACYQHCLT